MTDQILDAEIKIDDKHKSKEKVVEPKLYNIIFHNDDITPFQFVIYLIQEVFHESESRAVAMTQKIHNSGSEVVGTFTQEIAMEKLNECNIIIEQFNYHLKITCEVEQGE